LDSLHDTRPTGHIKIFLKQEKHIIDSLVNIIDDQAQYLFEQCSDIIDEYTLVSPKKAFISMFFDINSNEEYKKYVPKNEQNPDIDLYLITNINAMRDFHNPCIDRIHKISYLCNHVPGDWISYLYHMHKDPEFNGITQQKLVFHRVFANKKHIEKFIHHGKVKQKQVTKNVQLNNAVYFHYVIGRFESYYDVLKENVDLTPILVLLRNPIKYDNSKTKYKTEDEKPRQRFW